MSSEKVKQLEMMLTANCYHSELLQWTKLNWLGFFISRAFGQQKGDYSRPRDAIKSVSQIENNPCTTSFQNRSSWVDKSLVMSPRVEYEADTYMGSVYLNPPVRSKYFNYQLRPANLHFMLNCFNSFCPPSTTYHCPDCKNAENFRRLLMGVGPSGAARWF